jgi:hypothetical protein
VNAFLRDTGDGLALIDTGIPDSTATILIVHGRNGKTRKGRGGCCLSITAARSVFIITE